MFGIAVAVGNTRFHRSRSLDSVFKLTYAFEWPLRYRARGLARSQAGPVGVESAYIVLSELAFESAYYINTIVTCIGSVTKQFGTVLTDPI